MSTEHLWCVEHYSWLWHRMVSKTGHVPALMEVSLGKQKYWTKNFSRARWMRCWRMFGVQWTATQEGEPNPESLSEESVTLLRPEEWGVHQVKAQWERCSWQETVREGDSGRGRMEGRRESSVWWRKEAGKVGRARPYKLCDFGLRGKGNHLRVCFG